MLEYLFLFVKYSAFTFFLYHIFDFTFSKSSISYNQYNLDKKRYIVSNIIKSLVLGYIIIRHYNLTNDIIYNNWNDIDKLKKISTLYAVTDFVSLFMVKRMHMSTFFHHIVVNTFHISNIVNNFENYSLNRLIVVYGFCSSLSFLVNMYLSLRFIVKNKETLYNLKRSAYYTYVFCCGINWLYQIYYLINWIYYYPYNYLYYIYILFVVILINDDLILMNFLRK